MDQDWALDRLDDTSGDINLYWELIVNNAEKVDTILSETEQWSVLSNVVNYIRYDRHPKNFHNLDVKAVNQRSYKRRHNTEEERFWRHARNVKRRIVRYWYLIFY